MKLESFSAKPTCAIDSPAELFFDQLRDIRSMHLQLVGSYHEVGEVATDAALRELVIMQAFRTNRYLIRLESIFARHGREVDGNTCKTIKGVNEGGVENLQMACGRLTRDLMVTAHCCRLFHYGFAVYDMAVALANQLDFLADLELLESPRMEHWAALRRLGQIRRRLCGISEAKDSFFPALDVEG